MAGIDNGWYDNYSVDSPTSYNQNQIDARYDQNITEKDGLYLTYHYLNSNSLVTDPYHGATVVPGGGDADQGNKEDQETQTVSVTYTHVLWPDHAERSSFRIFPRREPVQPAQWNRLLQSTVLAM